MTQQDDARAEEVRMEAARAASEDTDVVLDVPVLNVEELDLEVEELRAHISARAELAGFLNISVGVDAYIDKVKLNIKGVEAQVQLKVKLERILSTIERALDAIDTNPGLLDAESRERDRRAERDRPRELAAAEETGEAAGAEATSAARKKAEDLGIELSSVEGTGANGRILVKDVLGAAGG